MWRTTLDLPEAMQLKLEALATAQGVAEDQIVRKALVAFGIGNTSHVVGIRDGTYSDDNQHGDDLDPATPLRPVQHTGEPERA